VDKVCIGNPDDWRHGLEGEILRFTHNNIVVDWGNGVTGIHAAGEVVFTATGDEVQIPGAKVSTDIATAKGFGGGSKNKKKAYVPVDPGNGWMDLKPRLYIRSLVTDVIAFILSCNVVVVGDRQNPQQRWIRSIICYHRTDQGNVELLISTDSWISGQWVVLSPAESAAHEEYLAELRMESLGF
jgi:hypothetical protein